MAQKLDQTLEVLLMFRQQVLRGRVALVVKAETIGSDWGNHGLYRRSVLADVGTPTKATDSPTN